MKRNKAEIPTSVKQVPQNAVTVACACGRVHIVDGGAAANLNRWASLSDASKVTGYGRAQIKRAVETGRLEKRIGSGRGTWLVWLAAIENAVAPSLDEDDDLLARAIGRHRSGGVA